MKSDDTSNPEWIKQNQDRLVAWELLQRTLRGEGEEPMTKQEWRKTIDRCGLTEADYDAIIHDNRKRMREGGCPEGMRLMSNAK